MSSSSKVKRSTSTRPPAAVRAASPSNADRHGDFSMTGYDMLASAESFDEPLNGMHTRELLSADVFRHYFGGLVARQ